MFTSVKVHFMNLPKGVLDPVKRYFIACVTLTRYRRVLLLFEHWSHATYRHNGDIADSAQDATHLVTEPPWTPVRDFLCRQCRH